MCVPCVIESKFAGPSVLFFSLHHLTDKINCPTFGTMSQLLRGILRKTVFNTVRSISVQKPAPTFEATAVVDKAFKTIKLSDYLGKYVVMFFYPLDFTFVCPTEIIAFNDRAKEFQALNTELIAVSVDSHFSHLAWVNTPRKAGGLGSMQIPIISDLNKKISTDYGVLLEKEGIALRGLFLIDPKGIVRHITINDLPVGRCVDETLRLVKAFQFVEKHGEVCPANWKPDSPTIDPKNASTYFEKVN